MPGDHVETRARRRRPWPWLLLALVAAYVAGHWALRVVPDSLDLRHEQADRAFMDFDVYLTAARRVAVGASVYAPADTLPRPPCIGPEALAYLYPPLLAVLLRPLAATSPCQAERIWFAINLAAVAMLPWLLVQLVGRARSPAWWALALGVAAAPMATLETVALGQVNALVLVAMLGAVILAGRGRVWPAALLLALAVGLKGVPVALGLVALAPGRRRLLVAVVVATAAVLALSFALAPGSGPGQFLRVLDGRTEAGISEGHNASWVAAVVRAGGTDPGPARLLSRLNTLLVLAAAALAWWRARGDLGPLRLVALGFALSVALSPVFEVHHQMLLYPALMVLAVAIGRQPHPGWRVAGSVGLVLLAAVLNSRGLVPPERASSLADHLLVKPAGAALWILIAWLLCLRDRRLE